MVDKSWITFVTEYLKEVEKSGSNDSTDEQDSYLEDDINDSNSVSKYKKTWCNSLDRSFGYAFRLFCRFVVLRTLNESSIKKRYKISSEDFIDVIDRNFKYKETRQPKPLPKYYKFYPRYAKWHNRMVKEKRLRGNLKTCNMSFFRKRASQKFTPKKKEIKITPERLLRYKIVKPVHQFPKVSLSEAFE
ncbi:hypothetical protein TpMuguga_04g00779 [Theileria parva strain Muguga]|uniref:uncharacterized protein n=1 Tax=Theileria parva strain Muguga TaxID=333668 RepID=UPI001C617F9E|nr:uncharacterized protein TpMuguga_04g00779 [Theileria parva strain Muguga]EAN32132.2 hypothetical protein TpMuguga_04g00779 [Theileria parva strain Muguga]